MRDALVVGGGPAGSVTAMLLARAGWDVALLDAQQFPRPKPCGDCISPGANELLRGLGVWSTVLAARPAELVRWRLASDAESFSAGFENTVSLALPRERFDAILLAEARRSGVEVHTGARVRELLRAEDAVVGVSTGSSVMRSRLTIGADGLRSRTARLLHAYLRKPRIRKLSFTVHLPDVRHVPNTGEMHVLKDVCLGIAPVERGAQPLCNVTVVLKAGTAAPAGPHEMLRSALRRMARPDIAELIRDDVSILTSGPFDWPVRHIAFDGAALVGDAAGYFDPFTGQGIYQAIAGAHLLAETACTALRSKRVHRRTLAPYAAAHGRMMGATRRVQHTIDYVCAHPRLAASAFGALGRTPELAQRLIAVTGDLRPARDLLSPRLLTRFMAASLGGSAT